MQCAATGRHSSRAASGWGSCALLDLPGVRALYSELADAFPLRDDVLALYHGPGTTRERHPLMRDDVCWTNGMRRLLVGLAAA